MSFIDDLNHRYFNGELSPAVLTLLAPVDKERPEVQAFVRRACDQLYRQHVRAQDFPQTLAWVIAAMVPKILPGAWGGAVPPITQKGRHAVIDDYLVKNPWRPLADGDHLLDLGCGYPPVTTLETAARFSNCRVTGADPTFGGYLVRESNGDYAVFDRNSDLVLFQTDARALDRWGDLYADPARTRARFARHLAALRASLPTNDDGFSSVERDGIVLVRNPAQEFNGDNVAFRPGGFGSGDLTGYQAVRCFNVLMYFDDVFRQKALDWLPGVVDDAGIFICGVNNTFSGYERYAVYRAEDGAMAPKEFAFSIGNIRPLELITVFTLHDDDRDRLLMASLTGLLRTDPTFRDDFDRRLDELIATYGLGARSPDGYLGPLSRDTDARRFVESALRVEDTLVRDGFNHRAVEVLRARGYDAWVNCVGHVAVDPKSASF